MIKGGMKMKIRGCLFFSKPNNRSHWLLVSQPSWRCFLWACGTGISFCQRKIQKWRGLNSLSAQTEKIPMMDILFTACEDFLGPVLYMLPAGWKSYGCTSLRTLTNSHVNLGYGLYLKTFKPNCFLNEIGFSDFYPSLRICIYEEVLSSDCIGDSVRREIVKYLMKKKTHKI